MPIQWYIEQYLNGKNNRDMDSKDSHNKRERNNAKQQITVDIHENHVQRQPCLVIAIHDDAPFGTVSYHNTFAKKVSGLAVNVVAVGLLRPGYKDERGRKSNGRKGWAVGDNYDRKRIEQIVVGIRILQQRYRPIKTIVAGHSGGAAITAKMLAYYPDLMDSALIVSCSADINAWRKDMLKLRSSLLFFGKIACTSPLDLVKTISNKAQIHVICGAEDEVTRPYLSERYVTKLIQAGKQVHYDVITGDHDIFLHPFVLASVAKHITHSHSLPINTGCDDGKASCYPW
ncbi:alpha/beta hydrolase family protein [Shewanella surugensis]|uniref:Lysophospholipase n=1 Tax=Shewanella surugensis TaxID=212020 RepID=A0ABT0LJL6_9GAMM|nr:lysophospholipase [Shewanella surugensis]MCL1127886.1 lysophospholipase [Shewanella surugensis]